MLHSDLGEDRGQCREGGRQKRPELPARENRVHWKCPEKEVPKSHTGPELLGKQVEVPASPEEAELDRVENPHQDVHYLARFTAPEFTSLCPVTGQPDFAHLVIDYVPGEWLRRIEVAEALPLLLPQSRRLPRGLHRRASARIWPRCSSRSGCGSAATGIRAAAFRSMSFGRPARRRRAFGCRTRACRRIGGAGKLRRQSLRRRSRAAARALPELGSVPAISSHGLDRECGALRGHLCQAALQARPA